MGNKTREGRENCFVFVSKYTLKLNASVSKIDGLILGYSDLRLNCGS